MNSKAASRIQPTIKKRASRGSVKIGSHKDAYSLYTREGRKPRSGKVTVTVDMERVATAFATKIDRNHTSHYNPVILPNSHTITR